MPRPSITFVSGDTGGARTALALSQELSKMGWEVHTVSDPEGEGRKIFEGMTTNVSETDMAPVIRQSDLLYVATCSTAYKTAHNALAVSGHKDKTIFGVDGYFNHAFPQWRGIDYGYWFAADEYHAKAIGDMRLLLPKGNIRVTGLPAFDNLPALYARKDEIRKSVRDKLKITPDQKVVLWWSHGTGEVAAEDVEMVLHGLFQLLETTDMVFVPRLHPKLNVEVSPGYVQDTTNLLKWFVSSQATMVLANDVEPTELDLAADVVITATSSEATKCVMLGLPPVVHLLGPRNRDWLTKMGVAEPFIPYLSAGRVLVARSVTEVGDVILKALEPATQEQLRAGWSPPTGGAAKRGAELLASLVQ